MVEIEREAHAEHPYEKCCFCRAPTSYWVVNKDVACCPMCASRAHPSDVPSKKVWCRRERIADHSFGAEGWSSPGKP